MKKVLNFTVTILMLLIFLGFTTESMTVYGKYINNDINIFYYLDDSGDFLEMKMGPGRVIEDYFGKYYEYDYDSYTMRYWPTSNTDVIYRVSIVKRNNREVDPFERFMGLGLHMTLDEAAKNVTTIPEWHKQNNNVRVEYYDDSGNNIIDRIEVISFKYDESGYAKALQFLGKSRNKIFNYYGETVFMDHNAGNTELNPFISYNFGSYELKFHFDSNGTYVESVELAAPYYTTSFTQDATLFGITLGMTRSQVEKILGKGVSKREQTLGEAYASYIEYQIGDYRVALSEGQYLRSIKVSYANISEKGYIVKDIYYNPYYTFYVEVDKSDEISPGIYRHYLYLHINWEEKRLIARSVNRGEDWTNSVASILNPTLSSDWTRVYYETDSAFTRTSGIGANNHRTRVVDLQTMEDSYFNEGGIAKLLTEKEEPYTNAIILERYTWSDDYRPVTNYYLHEVTGDELLNLGEYLEEDIVDQINRIYMELIDFDYYDYDYSGIIDEYIHGEFIEYSRYFLVVIEDYKDYGLNYFENIVSFRNPLYTSGPYNYYNFAVFGTIRDVKLRTKQHLDSAFRVYHLADVISDSLVEISSKFPTDFSVDIITFIAEDGNEYSIIVEDMSDEKDIVKIFYPF